jgi:hypothetical protein
LRNGYFAAILRKLHANAGFWPSWCNWVEFFANLAWMLGFGRKKLKCVFFDEEIACFYVEAKWILK